MMVGSIKIFPRGKHSPASFFLNCQCTIFKEPLIHERRLSAAQLCSNVHTKCSIVADDIQFSQVAMMRVVNNTMLHLISTEPTTACG
jgi:hypothetical protein